jgi:membrane protease YdiL (CAAX protease family)
MLTKSQVYFFAPLIVLLLGLSATHLIPPIAAGLVFVFALVLSLYNYLLHFNKPVGLYLTWTIAVVLGIAVGLYRPAGFSYPLVFSVNQLYEGGSPFSLYVNTAKLLTGYIIIYFLISSRFVSNVFIHSRLQQYIFAIGLGAIVVLIASLFLGLEFHLKPLTYIVMFGLANLLVTCVAEEAFMRLLLQAQLQKFISGKVKSVFWLEAIPLIIATVIFVLTHLAKSPNAILIFVLAGFSYGLVYSLTKNLWACVVAHFIVNIIHFSLLTYPLA